MRMATASGKTTKNTPTRKRETGPKTADTSTGSYQAKDIEVLEGLEAVRRRPAMYIGTTDNRGLHHLLWELVDNSVDEFLAGETDRINVTLHKDGSSITVSDNGRGIPVDKHPKSKTSALELIMTTLHAGGKFTDKNYARSGGLHGVGSSVVNALSTELIVTVKRDGSEWMQAYNPYAQFLGGWYPGAGIEAYEAAMNATAAQFAGAGAGAFMPFRIPQMPQWNPQFYTPSFGGWYPGQGFESVVSALTG